MNWEEDRKIFSGLTSLTDAELDAKITERLNMLIEAEAQMLAMDRAHQRAVEERNYRNNNV